LAEGLRFGPFDASEFFDTAVELVANCLPYEVGHPDQRGKRDMRSSSSGVT
jgi:hypothetical protein